ncbi:MAG: hypothetical protein GXY16_05765 [Syntrophomonadaceae bacterium]|jgi:hypothetical protein|nr:hypothetical protein [Syntrophomonadaceae bacterium]
MDNGLRDFILAIVTMDYSLVQGGGCPVFLAENATQQNKISMLLARILGGIVHDLENGVYLIVKH